MEESETIAKAMKIMRKAGEELEQLQKGATKRERDCIDVLLRSLESDRDWVTENF